ncbi:MAG: phosphatidate cytidylyltransferase [Chloroflexi bacterium]|nr:phosphatidate cytidylyltransferase [Chloroflexota bacterium]
MLRPRLLVAIVLVPLAVGAIYLGGAWYLAGVLIVLTGAGREYVNLMRAGGRQPALPLVLLGIWFLSLAPLLAPGTLDRIGLTAFLVVATFWHLVQFERGTPNAASDWAATIAGAVYIGALGSFFLLLRHLPEGLWWTAIVYPSIWLSDTGAFVGGNFLAGRFLGRHAMVPKLSPKKTWEGFVSGVVWGTAFGALFGAFWEIASGPGSRLGFWPGAIVGLVVSLAGPIGDLAISMLKRQVGLRDTGNALAGHGGMLDRIDSWLVAGAAGYYCILLLLR